MARFKFVLCSGSKCNEQLRYAIEFQCPTCALSATQSVSHSLTREVSLSVSQPANQSLALARLAARFFFQDLKQIWGYSLAAKFREITDCQTCNLHPISHVFVSGSTSEYPPAKHRHDDITGSKRGKRLMTEKPPFRTIRWNTFDTR